MISIWRRRLIKHRGHTVWHDRNQRVRQHPEQHETRLRPKAVYQMTVILISRTTTLKPHTCMFKCSRSKHPIPAWSSFHCSENLTTIKKIHPHLMLTFSITAQSNTELPCSVPVESRGQSHHRSLFKHALTAPYRDILGWAEFKCSSCSLLSVLLGVCSWLWDRGDGLHSPVQSLEYFFSWLIWAAAGMCMERDSGRLSAPPVRRRLPQTPPPNLTRSISTGLADDLFSTA